MAHHDQAVLSDGMSAPGIDPRTWFSHGTVELDSGDDHSVRFNDETGTPLPYGVLIDVKLHPSGIKLPCRVGMHSAGPGEAEYNPFGPGDEVYVSIPDGDFKGGGVIISRGSNGLDTFPTSVAGVDVTQNNIAFKRIKAPYILETGASYMIRSALTNASFSMDPTGNVLLTDGNGAFLALNNACLQLSDSTNGALFQIDVEKLQATIIANGTSFLFDQQTSIFLSSGVLQLCTSGVGATGHAVTMEQVCSLLIAVFLQIGIANPGPILGATLAAGFLQTLMSAIPVTATPIASALLVAPAIQAALAIPPDPTGTLTGYGIPGLQF